MTEPRDAAPSAGEELEREIREAETVRPEGSRDGHDSEAGDTLTPNLAAQREAGRSEDPDTASGPD